MKKKKYKRIFITNLKEVRDYNNRNIDWDLLCLERFGRILNKDNVIHLHPGYPYYAE